MKTGLVLEGGGMRALFGAGVMDVMLENGIAFDGIIGVSAGACFGSNYKSKQPGRGLRYNLRFAKDPRYMGLRCLLREGNIVSPGFAYHLMPTKLDVFDFETYRRNPAAFYAVSCDIETARPVYRKIDEMDHEGLEWLRASASMPLVSTPVEIGGRKLLDGGMADSIPLRAFNDMGYGRNIVVLTQPSDYKKAPTKLAWAFKSLMKKYPAVGQLMADRHNMYNAQLDYVGEQARGGRALVFCPDKPLDISRTSSDKARMTLVYQMGRAAAQSRLDGIKDFLAAAKSSDGDADKG